jgi:hypothetical protein
MVTRGERVGASSGHANSARHPQFWGCCRTWVERRRRRAHAPVARVDYGTRSISVGFSSAALVSLTAGGTYVPNSPGRSEQEEDCRDRRGRTRAVTVFAAIACTWLVAGTAVVALARAAARGDRALRDQLAAARHERPLGA